MARPGRYKKTEHWARYQVTTVSDDGVPEELHSTEITRKQAVAVARRLCRKGQAAAVERYEDEPVLFACPARGKKRWAAFPELLSQID